MTENNDNPETETKSEPAWEAETILTPEKVHALFKKCLFIEGENTENAILVTGVAARYGLHPDRVKAAIPEISELLNRLPKEFRVEMGGGWSFLNACVTLRMEQWGEHVDVEALMVLGLASGLVKYSLPRETWHGLPGGLPYFHIFQPEALLNVGK